MAGAVLLLLLLMLVLLFSLPMSFFIAVLIVVAIAVAIVIFDITVSAVPAGIGTAKMVAIAAVIGCAINFCSLFSFSLVQLRPLAKGQKLRLL